jgi:PPK2 family polyphosphate:nucleotide phosphotransferase
MDTKQYRIINKKSNPFLLSGIDPGDTGKLTKLEAIEQTVGNTLDLRPLQDRLYAHDRYSVLIIFQAMDAAGKDSTINNVLSGINPQGCYVKSFKHPSDKELSQDYLWRSTVELPPRGMIGVFNRSYYEEVLIARVHPEIVLKQNLPGIEKTEAISEAFWEERYRQINAYEQRLRSNGVIVIKFFLHLSKKEQAKRFLKRIRREDKNWKFSPYDMQERAFWDDYQSAYERCIQRTATVAAPWYVVPADHKWYTRAVVSTVIAETIQKLNPTYPSLDEVMIDQLAVARKQLENELK